MSVKMEVWGETACFTRPEMKAERVSYDVPTPSAARGMLESVYYHPGLKWHIDRIWVLKPIRFTTLRRNEVKSKILGSAILTEANGKGASCIDRSAGHHAARCADAAGCALRDRSPFHHDRSGQSLG